MNKVRLLETLLFYKGKDFINRIINAGDFPFLENRDGTKSTHGMAVSEKDGKFYVYPTVVYEGGIMQRLGPDTAWNRAITSGDFIEFETEEDARDFSKEYKQFMPMFEAAKEDTKKIWKDLNTGPGTLSSDSMSGANDGN